MDDTQELGALLSALRPEVRAGEFVFVPLTEAVDVETFAIVREDEAVTYVVQRSTADEHGWPYDFVAGWITLRLHSSLAAIGLTAAVSGAMAGAGISCNMLAGYFHDHLLVPVDRVADAMAVLQRLSSDAAAGPTD
ncbi:MAG: ACT domain-containing protein [Actinobacteria bacterium]|nr:ACT domain-containing protein [Actinomycetota bacterium]